MKETTGSYIRESASNAIVIPPAYFNNQTSS